MDGIGFPGVLFIVISTERSGLCHFDREPVCFLSFRPSEASGEILFSEVNMSPRHFVARSFDFALRAPLRMTRGGYASLEMTMSGTPSLGMTMNRLRSK